ncbi:MAG: AAA family ATPase [Candidatus Staskawiczbacteria bacterium]|nr:AAA family ATPase [Candidatus Staskawiczbacteria bacterium]
MLIGHKKQWEFLEAKHKLNQLAHAYLFTGAEGIGKKTFAEEFAGFIGCKFPDLLIIKSINSKSSIENKRDSLEIDVGQVRDALNFLSYKSYNGGYKVVIVDNAERMNVEAQSCFLKTLEEPKGNTILVMVSSKPDMLLSTIFSRCQTVKFFKPKDLPKNSEKVERDKEILDVLLPVLNSTLADKFKYVKAIDWEKQELSEILEVMQRYYRDMLLADYGNKKIINILNLIEDVGSKALFTNINPKLALEILLMEV